jgi:hypothetical protein
LTSTADSIKKVKYDVMLDVDIKCEVDHYIVSFTGESTKATYSKYPLSDAINVRQVLSDSMLSCFSNGRMQIPKDTKVPYGLPRSLYEHYRIDHVISTMSPINVVMATLAPFNVAYNRTIDYLDDLIALITKHQWLFRDNSAESTYVGRSFSTSAVRDPRHPHISKDHLCNQAHEDTDCPTDGVVYAGNILTLLLNMIKTDVHRKYFLSDLDKMTPSEFGHIINELCKKVFTVSLMEFPTVDLRELPDEYYTVLINHSTPPQLKKCAFDSNAPILFEIQRTVRDEGIFNIYDSVVKSMGAHIRKFPLKDICLIPKLNSYPETEFQWRLLNNVCDRSSSKFVEGDVQGNTREVIDYIRPSIKSFELYKKYRNPMNPDVEAMHGTEVPLESNDPNWLLNDMITFIADGIELSENITQTFTVSDGSILKMAPMTGSILKLVRNSIFNHRLNSKISLNLKLMDLKGDSDLMPRPVNLPDAVAEYFIAKKSDLIKYGAELDHCIGGKINSKNLLFRKGTVCAEVNIDNGSVRQCYDKKNQITPESKEFRAELTEVFSGQLTYNESIDEEQPPVPENDDRYNRFAAIFDSMNTNLDSADDIKYETTHNSATFNITLNLNGLVQRYQREISSIDVSDVFTR